MRRRKGFAWIRTPDPRLHTFQPRASPGRFTPAHDLAASGMQANMTSGREICITRGATLRMQANYNFYSSFFWTSRT
jgi:hypothetical protein